MISSFVGLLGGVWTLLGSMLQAAGDGDRGQQMDPNG